MAKGWISDSMRHGLSAKGIASGRKKKKKIRIKRKGLTKTQIAINKIVFQPTKEQTDNELLEIIVRKDKAHYFDFLTGFTEWGAVGKWEGQPKEQNTLIQIQFKDSKDEKYGLELESLLKKYNKDVIKEDKLFFRTLPVEETSL